MSLLTQGSSTVTKQKVPEVQGDTVTSQGLLPSCLSLSQGLAV